MAELLSKMELQTKVIDQVVDTAREELRKFVRESRQHLVRVDVGNQIGSGYHHLWNVSGIVAVDDRLVVQNWGEMVSGGTFQSFLGSVVPTRPY